MTARAAGPRPGPLRIDGVVKRFGGATALDGLTLVLWPGECLGIAGPNGSGKTTLIDVLSGFVRPDAGAAWLAGQEITRWPPHRIVRAGIARTFQRPALAGALTVQEHLRAASLHRRLGARGWRGAVDTVLEQLGLTGLRGRDARTLSAEESRRVDLGRALATGAHVLLLDEPPASAEMLSALRRLRGGGLTMLIAAHGAALLDRLCDRVACIERGRIVLAGPHARAGETRDA